MTTKIKNTTNEPRVVFTHSSPPIAIPARGTVKVKFTGFSMRVGNMQGQIIAQLQVPRRERAKVLITDYGVVLDDEDGFDSD
ncbi:unnamed protein product [Lampetra fluviatilis]